MRRKILNLIFNTIIVFQIFVNLAGSKSIVYFLKRLMVWVNIKSVKPKCPKKHNVRKHHSVFGVFHWTRKPIWILNNTRSNRRNRLDFVGHPVHVRTHDVGTYDIDNVASLQPERVIQNRRVSHTWFDINCPLKAFKLRRDPYSRGRALIEFHAYDRYRFLVVFPLLAVSRMNSARHCCEETFKFVPRLNSVPTLHSLVSRRTTCRFVDLRTLSFPSYDTRVLKKQTTAYCYFNYYFYC